MIFKWSKLSFDGTPVTLCFISDVYTDGNLVLMWNASHSPICSWVSHPVCVCVCICSGYYYVPLSKGTHLTVVCETKGSCMVDVFRVKSN